MFKICVNKHKKNIIGAMITITRYTKLIYKPVNTLYCLENYFELNIKRISSKKSKLDAILYSKTDVQSINQYTFCLIVSILKMDKSLERFWIWLGYAMLQFL